MSAKIYLCNSIEDRGHRCSTIDCEDYIISQDGIFIVCEGTTNYIAKKHGDIHKYRIPISNVAAIETEIIDEQELDKSIVYDLFDNLMGDK